MNTVKPNRFGKAKCRICGKEEKTRYGRFIQRNGSVVHELCVVSIDSSHHSNISVISRGIRIVEFYFILLVKSCRIMHFRD